LSLRLIACGSVDSTNSESLRRLDQGAEPPFLLMAEAQTKGRGRSGKVWSSPSGNFYGTFALPADQADATMAQVSFVAALALAHVLEGLGLKPELKWPNDILIKGAKISGILLEKQGPILLVGMGINLGHHPGLPDYPSTSLAELGHDLSPQDMASQLALQFDAVYTKWQAQGFATIREAWLGRAYKLGETITARLSGHAPKQGRFAGLAGDGALQLRTDAGLELVHAGEVYFHAAGH